jgi:hypothetical protein
MHPVDVLMGFVWGWVFGMGLDRMLVVAVNALHRRA